MYYTFMHGRLQGCGASRWRGCEVVRLEGWSSLGRVIVSPEASPFKRRNSHTLLQHVSQRQNDFDLALLQSEGKLSLYTLCGTSQKREVFLCCLTVLDKRLPRAFYKPTIKVSKTVERDNTESTGLTSVARDAQRVNLFLRRLNNIAPLHETSNH